MKLLWIIPFLLPPQGIVLRSATLGAEQGEVLRSATLGAKQEKPHSRIIDAKITGQTSNACYEIVGRLLKQVKGVDRIIYWITKNDVRTHVVLKEGDLKLGDIEGALAAARKEMKETLRMEVDYRIDASALKLPAGTKVVVDGKEVAVEKETTLAELRKTTTVTDVVMPTISHPVCAFACPNGCSASDAKGRCPKCNEEFLPVEAPKPAGG